MLLVTPEHAGLPGGSEAALVEHRRERVAPRHSAWTGPVRLLALLPTLHRRAPWSDLVVPVLADAASVLVPPYLHESE